MKIIHLRHVSLGIVLAVGGACSSGSPAAQDSGVVDAGAGTDTPATDAGSPVDTPAADVAVPTDVALPDVAPSDTPAVDAPSPVDAPAADAPAPVDAPPPVDAPVPVDAPPPVDVPAPVDAPPPVDTPAPVDMPPPVDVPADNPAPRIAALSPASANAGDASFTLTIQGNGFLPGSTVTWAGAARTATYVNATTLRIAVTAADVAAVGTPAVVVTNPTPGGGSSTATFAVHVPFTSATWLPGSIYRSAMGWFTAGTRERLWLADIDNDRIDDVVGLDNGGVPYVSRGTGSGFAASAMIPVSTIFRVTADWFQTATHQRVWLTDVTGDGRADLVGVDFTGGVWVSESTGTGFNVSRLVVPSSFTNAAGFFAIAEQPHVFLGDVNADGKTDLLGINPATGRISAVVATGTGTTASFAAEAEYLATSILTTSNAWFRGDQSPRLFFGDVTGDRRADLVGFAGNGDLYVAECTGTGLNAVRRVGNTVFSDANGWFASPEQPRLSLADFNGDGKLDVVGVGAPAVGDGDVWTLESVGSGTTADGYQHVLLHESPFRAADGWFAATARQSVWFTDVTGDGRADLLGVDARGGVWVARSAVETSSPGVTPAGRHDFLLPAVLNGESGFTAAAYFDRAVARRLWVGDVTGDGARDLVAVSGAAGSDGDIRWRMASPATVRSVTPVTRQMLTAGSAQRVQVTLSRRITASSFVAGALEVAVNQGTVVPSAVATTATGATFDVTFPSLGSQDARLELALGARATDAWGHGIDGDGDGRPGGVASRPGWWSTSLVAGASRVSLMPDDATGVPRSSGFGYCSNLTLPATSSTPANPLEARIVVIAGGGKCSTSATCATGQTCVEGACQGASGVDANLPLVLVSLDLIGMNSGRLAELLESRYGIPKQNVVVSATHAHAAFRSIRLFNAPYFDDRRSGVGPYETWLEDRVADGVGAALADMTPVELAAASGTSSLGMNRHSGAPLSPEARTVSAVVLRSPGALARTRAVLVNFALHPVIMTGAAGINADFPGYLRQELESTLCPAGDNGCAALFLQGAAGDINPVSGTGTDDASIAQAQGRDLARVVTGLTLTFASTAQAQIQVRRRITNLVGLASCNVCSGEPQHVEAPSVWSARMTAVSIGVPGTPLLRFGTVPGEPFSTLQTNLMSGLTPAPLLLGYANGYLGYFPDQAAVGSNSGAYGVAVCARGSATGPTFFTSSASSPTHGDAMVTALRNFLTVDLR